VGSAHNVGELPPVHIRFTDDAIDDLRRIGHDAARQVLKKFGLLRRNPLAGPPLAGELTGYRKLVVGNRTWRIVYRVEDARTIIVCEIWAVGPRADGEVYREAVARVARSRGTGQRLVSLAGVLESFGRLARGLVPDEPEPPAIVPSWLAEKLITKMGLRPEVVAALSVDEAVAQWEEFMRRPR
jgi:mRNA interferase RelE/StbE